MVYCLLMIVLLSITVYLAVHKRDTSRWLSASGTLVVLGVTAVTLQMLSYANWVEHIVGSIVFALPGLYFLILLWLRKALSS